MKTTITKLIEAQIAQENDYIREHNQIKAILQQVEGKTISGTVLNAKRLKAFEAENGYSYRLERKYGMFYIIGKYDHLIGYDSEPTIFIDKAEGTTRGFEYFDGCHGHAALARIEQLKSIDIDKMTKIFGKIKDSFETIRECFGDVERSNLGGFHNPIYYDILRSIYDNNDPNKIRLSDFYFIRK